MLKNVNKLLNNNNNNNYILIGLQNKDNINIYIFEKLNCFLKQSNKEFIYKSYVIYKTNNIILHLNNNGSSNCYSEVLKYYDNININNYNILLYSYNQIKQNNDKFESLYIYDSIENIEIIVYEYKNINIKMIKNNNKYYIKIPIKNTTSESLINDIITLIINIV